MQQNKLLIMAGCLSIAAALAHIACIFGGPDWYRFFGAGEEMAQMAAAGQLYPTILTLVIAAMLLVWGLYAFSGAGLIVELPWLKTALVLITAVYLIRGVVGLMLPFLSTASLVQQNSMAFWLTSSFICCIFGGCYLFGTLRFWR